MRKSKKLVLGTVLAAVVLFGSLGGVALADEGDNPQPRAEFQEKLAKKLGITGEELQAKMAEIREELPQIDREGLPQRDGEGWQGKRGPAGFLEGLDEETQAALKEAMDEARERIQAGEDREEVMADIAELLASYGIDVDAMKAKFTENADGERPLKHGFIGPRGMGGMRGPSGPPAPVE